MKLPTSMWSAEIVCSAPPRLSAPWTVITLEPIPSTRAPIFVSSRARSWTWGSQAALEIRVGPGQSAAAINAFSVPITEGSSMKISQAQQPGRRGELDPAAAVDPGAEVLEGVEVGVEAATADEVAAGRRHLRLAEARQQRPGEQERGADLPRELLVHRAAGDAAPAQRRTLLSADPGDLDPELLEQRDLGFGVADPRHPVQQHLLLGQQAGGEDRQRRVLVAGDGQLPGEGNAALDNELLHRSG